MKIAICYPYIVNKADYYREGLKRFCTSIAKHPPGQEYDLFIEMCGGDRFQEEDGEWIGELSYCGSEYYGDGWDIGAHQHAANSIAYEFDFMICCCAHTFFHRDFWLGRMVAAREQFGPGLYGAMASFENNPHIRTCFFGFDPKILRDYPTVINSREKSLEFESGKLPMGFTPWVESQGLPVKMVAWDGVYDKADWRKPANVFRRGDQTNCLVWDRHTVIYQNATPEEKAATEAGANGP